MLPLITWKCACRSGEKLTLLENSLGYHYPCKKERKGDTSPEFATLMEKVAVEKKNDFWDGFSRLLKYIGLSIKRRLSVALNTINGMLTVIYHLVEPASLRSLKYLHESNILHLNKALWIYLRRSQDRLEVSKLYKTVRMDTSREVNNGHCWTLARHKTNSPGSSDTPGGGGGVLLALKKYRNMVRVGSPLHRKNRENGTHKEPCQGKHWEF